jgi:U3 small nucleolar RNA-associated protein MPP10
MPIENNFKPRFELDQEKSKLSLAEIYEQEYLQKVGGVEKEDPLDEKHVEIDALFKKLCYKLDALSNFHFVPKPVSMLEILLFLITIP